MDRYDGRIARHRALRGSFIERSGHAESWARWRGKHLTWILAGGRTSESLGGAGEPRWTRRAEGRWEYPWRGRLDAARQRSLLRASIGWPPAIQGASSQLSEPRAGAAIRVRGQLGSEWSVWFEGLGVAATVDGDTTLTGQLADQSALHGVLARIRDLGLELLSVTAEAEQAAETASEV